MKRTYRCENPAAAAASTVRHYAARLPNAIPLRLRGLPRTGPRPPKGVAGADKRGAHPEGRVPKLLDRLGIDPEAFIAASTTLLTRFGSVGTPELIAPVPPARPRRLRRMRTAELATPGGVRCVQPACRHRSGEGR
ncbi:hypothetical protein DSL92_06185 [Billgrantia gudaonensis]|uniref:Uncharacterized protein n=1 Tax=Billgrantia gudaonensis TaxID=376427 RepID=A0A3S0NH90_9GAMM|nr:hypothetical protein DSL92_06185 [Halomonas gudaonensis]